jgi:hypothetical protein
MPGPVVRYTTTGDYSRMFCPSCEGALWAGSEPCFVVCGAEGKLVSVYARIRGRGR